MIHISLQEATKSETRVGAHHPSRQAKPPTHYTPKGNHHNMNATQL